MNNIETETFGVHLMLDGYEADPVLLADQTKLRELLDTIPKLLSMTTIAKPMVVEVGPLNQKDPGGLSGFVLIAESHISFHTFPKRQFITIDVYTCQPDMDIDKVTKILKESFKIGRQQVYVQKRGIDYPSENLIN